MANTYSLAQIWDLNYQVSHYKQPVFRAFAEEKFEKELKFGATFNRQFASDLVVNDMGANGSYTVQGFTNTNEVGVVDKKKEVSIQIVEWQKLQDHLPTQMKYTTKAANALWLQVDADMLAAGAEGAASYIDNPTMTGSGNPGDPFALSVSNVANIFFNAIQQLQLRNVDYEPNKTLSKDVKLETISNALVAAISPQLYTTLLQYIGGKNTVLGDSINRNGHVGIFGGFNLFVSNNLLYEAVLKLGANPSANDTITLLSGVTIKGVSQNITFTLKSSVSNPGDIKIGSDAAATAANIAAALNSPYTAISGVYVPFNKSSLTIAQQKILNNISAAVDSSSNTKVRIKVVGGGSVPVSVSMTSNANVIESQIQHNLFGTSKSISLLMQKSPGLFLNPVSGAVARDLVTWALYGIKVFTDQSAQLVDVRVDCSGFGANGAPAILEN